MKGESGSVRLETIDGALASIVLDAGAEPFVFDEARVKELVAVVGAIAARKDLKGVVVRATHPTVFCAGADLDAIASITTRAEAERLVMLGQNAYEDLARLPVPTVALIHGLCVGGGLELALACTARVATDQAKLGLPEVKLGILPAWGGSTRLPRLIGLVPAIEMITAGKIVNASRALRLGIVDMIAPKELLLEAARKFIHESTPRIPKRDSFAVRALTAIPNGREFLRGRARAKILGETKGHYPAPAAALDVILKQHGQPRAVGFDLERATVATMIETPVARELIRLFKITRDGARPAIYAASADAAPIREVAVIGAGVMGAGIAEVCVRAGMNVRVIDAQPASLARARAAIDAELRRLVQRKDLTDAERTNRLMKTTFSTEITGLKPMDLVIEAVPERLEIKDKVLRSVASAVRPGALIATNTSSYALSELASAVAHPERFLGLHFFNPAPKMPLVEVVRGKTTSEAALARGVRCVRDLGKTPVVVADSPGFLVNRVLAPYLREACLLAEEGVPMAVIDRELEVFGMPMGPFLLMDTIGLDVLSDVSEHLRARVGGEPLHPVVLKLAIGGDLGKKSGRGFYRHGGGGRAANPSAGFPDEPKGWFPLPHEIVARLIGAMAREARAALAAGLVPTSEEVDIATVFGIGFPAFRGGVLRYASVVEEAAARASHAAASPGVHVVGVPS